jgi:hypothetical protein
MVVRRFNEFLNDKIPKLKENECAKKKRGGKKGKNTTINLIFHQHYHIW